MNAVITGLSARTGGSLRPLTPLLGLRSNARSAAVFATALLAFVCSAAGMPAFAQQCVGGYAPSPGPNSVNWTVTDDPSGVPLSNGVTVPLSGGYKKIKFHETWNGLWFLQLLHRRLTQYLETIYKVGESSVDFDDHGYDWL